MQGVLFWALIVTNLLSAPRPSQAILDSSHGPSLIQRISLSLPQLFRDNSRYARSFKSHLPSERHNTEEPTSSTQCDDWLSTSTDIGKMVKDSSSSLIYGKKNDMGYPKKKKKEFKRYKSKCGKGCLNVDYNTEDLNYLNYLHSLRGRGQESDLKPACGISGFPCDYRMFRDLPSDNQKYPSMSLTDIQDEFANPQIGGSGGKDRVGYPRRPDYNRTQDFYNSQQDAYEDMLPEDWSDYQYEYDPPSSLSVEQGPRMSSFPTKTFLDREKYDKYPQGVLSPAAFPSQPQSDVDNKFAYQRNLLINKARQFHPPKRLPDFQQMPHDLSKSVFLPDLPPTKAQGVPRYLSSDLPESKASKIEGALKDLSKFLTSDQQFRSRQVSKSDIYAFMDFIDKLQMGGKSRNHIF